MEDLELDPSPEFVKGFNEGYLLAEALPDLASDLIKAVGDSDRSKGFKSGYDQYELEHHKDFQISWMKSNDLGDRDIEADKERDLDKDDYDMDR